MKDSLERGSVRILHRRYEIGKKQIMEKIHQTADKIKDSVWIAKYLSPDWSSILIFDGKVIKVYDKSSKQFKGKRSSQEISWMNKKSWLCGVDYFSGDLPHYELADSETKIDLVMYFQTLKEIGYNLRVLVCDGNPQIHSAVRHVFGKDIIIQLCTRHFIEKLKEHAGKNKDKPRVKNMITLIQRLIEADNLEQAYYFLNEIKQIKRKTKMEKELIELFKKDSEKLTAHILYPDLNIPHTSNEIENIFRQLNMRLKIIGRFGHYKYARSYLRAWALFRRFTPYTDCRKHRKWRNGHAPIEIAGVRVEGVDCFRL